MRQGTAGRRLGCRLLLAIQSNQQDRADATESRGTAPQAGASPRRHRARRVSGWQDDYNGSRIPLSERPRRCGRKESGVSGAPSNPNHWISAIHFFEASGENRLCVAFIPNIAKLLATKRISARIATVLGWQFICTGHSRS